MTRPGGAPDRVPAGAPDGVPAGLPDAVPDGVSPTWGVRGLTVWFGAHAALRDVTLEVPAGQVTGVVGGDGAGKTTLLRILAGAAAPDAGEVRRPPAEQTGYLAASSGTYPDLSVDENLAFAAAGYGMPGKLAAARASQLLERTGLAAARQRLAGKLSGGMRQKLGVVRAMLHRPRLLVLDEPTTGVDPVSRADLWWLIARAAAEGAAVVLTTTYIDEAERAASVLVLEDGDALAQGKPEEIIASVPGTIKISPERLRGDAARRAWRRAGTWRVWVPPGYDGGADGTAGGEGAADCVTPDLQDAVIVAALARELWAGEPS